MRFSLRNNIKGLCVLSVFMLISLHSFSQACPATSDLSLNGNAAEFQELCSDKLVFQANFDLRGIVWVCANAPCDDSEHPLTGLAFYKNGQNIISEVEVTPDPTNCYIYQFTIYKNSPHYGAGEFGAFAKYYVDGYEPELKYYVQDESTNKINITGLDEWHLCGAYGFQPPTYGAYSFQRANKKIVTTCNTVVVNGAILKCRAGVSIELGPGFSAVPGSTFIGLIGPYCWPEGTMARVAEEGFEEIIPSQETDRIETLTFYPNPTNGKFTVESLYSSGATSLKVETMHGKIIYESPLLNSQEIDLSKFENGVYILKADIGGKIQSRKIILNK